MHNLSCENEFYLHENENIFSISKAENLTLFWPIMTSSHSLGSRTKESRFKGPYVKARDE